MRALLNRSGAGRIVDPVLRFGTLELDRERGEARVAGAQVRLTPKAALLLELLLRKPGPLVRRADIEATLWPDASPQARCAAQPDPLAAQVARRARLRWPRTVHGVGTAASIPPCGRSSCCFALGTALGAYAQSRSSSLSVGVLPRGVTSGWKKAFWLRSTSSEGKGSRRPRRRLRAARRRPLFLHNRPHGLQRDAS